MEWKAGLNCFARKSVLWLREMAGRSRCSGLRRLYPGVALFSAGCGGGHPAAGGGCLPPADYGISAASVLSDALPAGGFFRTAVPAPFGGPGILAAAGAAPVTFANSSGSRPAQGRACLRGPAAGPAVSGGAGSNPPAAGRQDLAAQQPQSQKVWKHHKCVQQV